MFTLIFVIFSPPSFYRAVVFVLINQIKSAETDTQSHMFIARVKTLRLIRSVVWQTRNKRNDN